MESKEHIHISGVDLPKQLYDAANNDTLVIFVGAGVSIPSGIQNFDGLTSEILEDRKEKFDKKLTSSEKLERAELEGINVQRETRRIIDQNNKGVSETHEHLVDFFRNKTMRLVTTNFDLNLSKAAQAKKIKHKTYCQPALPTGDGFDGIVYLHGAVTEEETPLVITEKDFARAYLKYGRQTAFVRELFTKFTVLFIGYSYDDKVIQLLTKSDADDSHRKDNPHYVLLEDTKHIEDPDKWKIMGLNAVPYPAATGKHERLWQVMREWGDLISMKPSEHQKEISRIARIRRAITRQEGDYIRCCLENQTLAQIFFNHARSEKWLEWMQKEGLLNKFFEVDLRPTELERLAFIWFADNFVAKRSDLALEIVRKNKSGFLNPHLVAMIALSFHRSDKLPPRNIFAKWVHIILSSGAYLSKDYISYILLKCRLPYHNDIALLLFGELTAPYSFVEDGHSGSTEHWLKEVWEKKFKPKISQLGLEVEPLITHQLKLHEFQEKAKYGLNVASYITRPAIEEHPDNHKFYIIDVLVDIARDILDHLLKKQPQVAKETIDRWYQHQTIILKRLSVYGAAKHNNLTPLEKLEWIISKKEILHPSLRHENFSLIKEIYKHLDNTQKIKLIDFVQSGEEEDYPVYNFVIWLNRISPECPIAKEKLEELQRKNPDFGPREDPDLSSHMTSGWVGHISPITVEDLLKMDLAKAVNLLKTYKGSQGFGKPEREGLLDTLRDAIKKDFNWSFVLANELAKRSVWNDDIWKKMLWYWREVEEITEKHSNEIVQFLLNHSNLHRHHYETARFLSGKEEVFFKNKKSENDAVNLAYLVRDVAFADKEADRIVVSDDIPNWWQEAINSTGYYVCYFLVRLFDKKYKKSVNKIEKLNEFFQPFLQNDSYSAQMGKVTLAHYLHFFFASADKKWTTDFIFPLFDWTIDTKNALQAWQAYLYVGTWNKGLFEGLLELHKKTFTHFKGLGELRENYCQHVAGLALYSIVFDKHDPLKTGWLRAFIKHCEEEDLQSFAYGIYLFLRDNVEIKKFSAKVWNKLLEPYLDQRISGKPQPLCKKEFAWIVKWCLHLDKSFAKCVKKIIEADETCDLLGTERTQHTDVFYRLSESEMLFKHPNTSGELVEHLLSKKHIALWDDRYLKKTVELLEESGCKKIILARIKEQSINLGFSI